MAEAASVVLLVRHGLTPTTGIKLPGRAPGLHLSDEGRRQADLAAERIGKLPKVAAVYCSPITRARETAQPIARAVKRALRIERDLADLRRRVERLEADATVAQRLAAILHSLDVLSEDVRQLRSGVGALRQGLADLAAGEAGLPLDTDTPP